MNQLFYSNPYPEFRLIKPHNQVIHQFTFNILNPFAWAEFVKAWKRGDFKSKKDKKSP